MENNSENYVVVTQTTRPGLPLVIISWVLLILLALFASIPFIGLASWLVAIPVLLIPFVFSIVILMSGRTVAGILILIFTVVVLPLYILIAPLVSTALTSVFMGENCGDTIRWETRTTLVPFNDRAPDATNGQKPQNTPPAVSPSESESSPAPVVPYI